MNNPACLSYWFPKIREAGLPTPDTRIYRTEVELIYLVDGETPRGFKKFIKQLEFMTAGLEFPVFMRTGLTSGKHSWKDTCRVESVKDFPQHVYNLVEFSAIADFRGLETDVWVIREFLKTDTFLTAFHGDMPITKERRYFVEGEKVICHHPYWPASALEGKVRNQSEIFSWQSILGGMNLEKDEEVKELCEMTLRVGRSIPGAWSVDWLWTTDRGWVLIDMAPMERSYHWPGCPHGR